MKRQLSENYFKMANGIMPGGVNSPVRSYPGLDLTPPVIKRGQGPYIEDVDGHRYLDFVLSWGPLILGHAPSCVQEAIFKQVELGTSFGAPTMGELELTQKIQEFFPCMEMIRLVNSGTEATMSALRLARGVTGRRKIIKFDGCYHGHGDALLVQAGSGALTHGEPNSPGVLKELAEHTLVAPFNDIDSLKTIFKRHAGDIAALIVEPVPGNMGMVLPEKDFLKEIRDLTSNDGAILIFDEVMSGFRVSPGGAVERYGVIPDLVCLGKIVGGGLPLAAYGGKRALMEKLSPLGPVYQAGTLSGNPLAVQAGLATLKQLQTINFDDLEKLGQYLIDGLLSIARAKRLPLQAFSCGAMFCVFFSGSPIIRREDVSSCNMEQFFCYFGEMLEGGIYLPPSQFEACFLSTEHKQSHLDEFLELFERIVGRLL